MDEVTRLILNDPQVQHECRIRSKAQALVWLSQRINRDVDSPATASFVYAGLNNNPPACMRIRVPAQGKAELGYSLYARQVVGAKQFECNGVFSDSLAECFAIADFVRKLTDGENDSIF
jgi:hypothetical protein